MRSNNPIQAKSTPSILRLLPSHFKMVQDKNSNGYKFTNMLYGVEVDEANERLKTLYDSTFLDTLDLSDEGILYEANLSGSKSETGYLDANGLKVKITSEDEFYNGSPTRAIYMSRFPITSGTNPIIGANYLRTDPRGSGYILLSYDVDEGDAYLSGVASTRKDYFDNLGISTSTSTDVAGVATQDYTSAGSDEVLIPISANVLSGRYPIYRDVFYSGRLYQIDHYEPYRGWIVNRNEVPVAVNDYFQPYQFNEDGSKVFFRTYLNNPFGAGNYSKQYFPLRHTPISGSLKIYDMDMLDVSGNATEVAASGTPVYYLSYSGMLDGSSGTFDSVYRGYSSSVPSGKGFQYIEGDAANLLTTTSWDYQREGSALDSESGVWLEPSAGNITNLLSITNPQSRYIVEYKWKTFNKAKYVSSFNANRYLSLETDQPLYSIENLSGNVSQIPFEFTKNSGLVREINGKSVDERSRILTFDGWINRPNSKIHKIDFDVPIVYTQVQSIKPFNVQYNYTYIGYSPEFIPQTTSIKSYIVDCPFDNDAPSYNAIEDDLTGNSNLCEYTATGSNKLFKIPYGSWYGKHIRYVSGDSYYSIDMTSKSFLKNNTFFKFKFRPLKFQYINLMTLHENDLGRYIQIYINSDGRLNVEMDGYNFISKTIMSMDSSDKEILVRYHPDDLYNEVPVIELFMKDKNFHYEVIKTFRQTVTPQTVTSTYIHLFKSCSIELDTFQIYYEAF